MQLSEQQINLLRELLGYIEFDLTGPTQEKVHKALEALDGLRAQADARPVAWQYRTRYDDNTSAPGWHDWEELKPRGPGQSMEDRVKEMQSYINGGAWYELRPLYTRPEASAPGLSEKKLLTSLCQWLLHRFGPNSPEGEEAQSRLRLISAASAATVAEPSTANLEGLAKALLAPREIVRDAYGWLDHPALPICDEGVRFDTLLDAFGLETYFRAMDGDVSPEEYDRYYDEQGGCAGWTPTPPEGDGWRLLAIYDTEDGPYAMFAREKQPEPRKRYGKAVQQPTKPPEQTSEADGKPTEQQAEPSKLGLTDDSLTEEKAAHIVERDGFAVTGYVLALLDGRRCIVEKSAVRWLNKDQMWAVMHPSEDDPQQAEPGVDERATFEEVIRSLTDPARHEEDLIREGDSYDRWPTALAWEIWKQARVANAGQRAGVAADALLEPVSHDDLPVMPSNVSHVVRRIRRCEGESGAQVVLEHFAMEYAKSAQSQIREIAWQAWISDAHRDQYIEAFLDSLTTAADRETERYLTRAFMGGWPMWVQANPREVSKTWFAVADSEPIELMPVLVSYHQHNNPSYPRSYGVAYRAEGFWVSDETGERIHTPTHWMHIDQIAAAPTQQQEGGK
ncbi:hypothetical protein CIG66_07170 [Ralstonia pseudosolanacearum]|uniref:hypothetical protein n=1 Tax=Ralstonia pseudosolanacearum TaxID=1310165 RepID=UPI000B9A0C8B|nr:hypothetical protein CIG66_07170 [Ralstonia pseudosolanacearum]